MHRRDQMLSVREATEADLTDKQVHEELLRRGIDVTKAVNRVLQAVRRATPVVVHQDTLDTIREAENPTVREPGA